MAYRPIHPSEVPRIPPEEIGIGEMYGSAAQTREAAARRERRWRKLRRLMFWRRPTQPR